MYICDNNNFKFDYTNPTVCPFNKDIPYSVWRYYGEKCVEFFPSDRVEILAPATASTFKTVVKNGADAIYFGYGSLNARAEGDNVTSFNEIVSYCHLFGVKAYLAINIMIKDSELAEAKRIIIEAEEAKIDAFIISDLALLSIIRRYSNARVHASTQMGIHNRLGAEFAEKLGFDRIILSREIDKKNLADIINHSKIETEIFVHGALCVGFSGACLMSSMLTGKSGNRGRCNQLCRREYKCFINGKKVNEGYLLSAKDICMAPKLDELKKLKVNSLKIEGRLKSDDYTGGVTDIYSRLNCGETYDKAKEDNLKILFNRGNFTAGYFDGNDIIYKDKPNHIGLKCGKIAKVISKNLVLITSNRPIYKGDCFKVMRKNVEIGGIQATGETKTIGNTVFYVAYTPCEAKENDILFMTKTVSKPSNIRNVQISLCIRIVGGEPVHIIATHKSVKYDYWGEIAEYAINEPLTQKQVETQLLKTGNTDFCFRIIKTVIKNAFLPKSKLNSIRRDIVDYFTDKLINDYSRPPKRNYNNPKSTDNNKIITGDFVEIENYGQYTDTVKNKFKNIVFSPTVYKTDYCKDFYDAVKSADNAVYIKFPIFIPSEKIESAEAIIQIFDGVVASNLGTLQMGKKYGKIVVADWNLNVANLKNPILKIADQTVVSTELNSKELSKFKGYAVYSFGKLPLMYLNHCPKKLAGISCSECSNAKSVVYRDNKGEYSISTKKLDGYCQHILKNSVITNLGSALPDNLKYFDFTEFDRREIDGYLSDYYIGKKEATSFNHLHLTRGVE